MCPNTRQSESDATYYCIKCNKHHRRSSDIGMWHEPLELPELTKAGGIGTGRPDVEQVAAAIALELARRATDSSGYVTEAAVRDRWQAEGFDDRFPNTDPLAALRALRDDFRTVTFTCFGGKNRVGWEATFDNYVQFRSLVKDYKTLGMAFGVRKDFER